MGRTELNGITGKISIAAIENKVFVIEDNTDAYIHYYDTKNTNNPPWKEYQENHKIYNNSRFLSHAGKSLFNLPFKNSSIRGVNGKERDWAYESKTENDGWLAEIKTANLKAVTRIKIGNTSQYQYVAIDTFNTIIVYDGTGSKGYNLKKITNQSGEPITVKASAIVTYGKILYYINSVDNEVYRCSSDDWKSKALPIKSTRFPKLIAKSLAVHKSIICMVDSKNITYIHNSKSWDKMGPEYMVRANKIAIGVEENGGNVESVNLYTLANDGKVYKI